MSIKCGHCKDLHETVADVKACAQGGLSARYPNAFGTRTASGRFVVVDNGLGGTTTRPVRQGVPATPKQLTFVKQLMEDRDLTGVTVPDVDGLTKTEASQFIDAALRAPFKAKAKVKTTGGYPDVPEGHYAVPSATGNNDLDFYRVDRPTEGRWAGRTFVKVVIGGHPDYAVKGVHAVAVLNRILDFGVEPAAIQYGQQIGRCYRCNRHLTDETSRRLGIGPDCRSK